MSSIGRKPTLLVVAVLCVGQFLWTCISEYSALGVWGVSAAIVAVLIVLACFERLRALGAVIAGRVQSKKSLTSLGFTEVEPHIGSSDKL